MTESEIEIGDAARLLAGRLPYEQDGSGTQAVAAKLECATEEAVQVEALARTLRRSLAETRMWMTETVRLLRAFPAEGLSLPVLVERLEQIGWAFAAVPARGPGLTGASAHTS